MTIILLLIAIVSHAFGASIVTRNGCKLYDDNYDNLVATGTVSTLSNYNGLLYSGWGTADSSLPTVPVTPHTEPNNIYADLHTDLLFAGAVTLYPFGNIAAGTGTSYFNLYSFYFGCNQDAQEGAANVATGCTISVTGYYVNGRQVPTATFAFAPKTAFGNPMNLATLPASYVGLKNVTFGVAIGDLVTQNTALQVDDIVHCNYS